MIPLKALTELPELAGLLIGAELFPRESAQKEKALQILREQGISRRSSWELWAAWPAPGAPGSLPERRAVSQSTDTEGCFPLHLALQGFYFFPLVSKSSARCLASAGTGDLFALGGPGLRVGAGT